MGRASRRQRRRFARFIGVPDEPAVLVNTQGNLLGTFPPKQSERMEPQRRRRVASQPFAVRTHEHIVPRHRGHHRHQNKATRLLDEHDGHPRADMDDFREHDWRQRVLGRELRVCKAPPYFLGMRLPSDRDKSCHLGALIAENEPQKKNPPSEEGGSVIRSPELRRRSALG
jgi:hypothetical protein